MVVRESGCATGAKLQLLHPADQRDQYSNIELAVSQGFGDLGWHG